nr:hypothetical protein [Polymorphobacter sp.]
MARFASPEDPTIFLVGQDVCGRYCVCENHGVIGGAFASRADAVRFAQDESKAIAHSIVLVTPVVISVDAVACSNDALPRRVDARAA